MLNYLHDHKETKCLLLFSLIYIQTMMKQSLDNDDRTIETSDSISFNFPTEIFQQTSYLFVDLFILFYFIEQIGLVISFPLMLVGKYLFSLESIAL